MDNIGSGCNRPLVVSHQSACNDDPGKGRLTSTLANVKIEIVEQNAIEAPR
jgi:hypothetical protein